ncbi:hypothetical protein ACFSR7_02995 [Cohnella sp. GCM10020058]|uniref:hypothetical protein n=1 Tax=Cohnella sp. GCM10020058 TaxID=3317330 RepID=UPI00362CADDF
MNKKTKKIAVTLVALAAFGFGSVQLALADADGGASGRNQASAATATPTTTGAAGSNTAKPSASGQKSSAQAGQGQAAQGQANAGQKKPRPAPRERGPGQADARQGSGQRDGSQQGSNCDRQAGAAPSGKASSEAAPAATAATSAVDANGYTITIAGGYETDPADHGRPVALIAAALGVPAETFREAFSGVTPAGADSGGPTEAEAKSNKAALLKVLAPYGITNDKLDEVSNYYRYNGSKGEVWKRTPAVLETIVVNGVVKGVKIVNPGAGYSSTPTVTIEGKGAKLTAKVEVSYTTDFSENGSIKTVTLQ